MAPRTSISRRPHLSLRAIEEARPGPTAYELTDGKSGLVLRVNPGGSKVFRWYITGDRRVITLGPWAAKEIAGHLTHGAARTALEDLKLARTAGKLDEGVAELHERLRPPPPPAPGDTSPTVETVAADFIKRRIQPHRKRHVEAAWNIQREIVKPLGARTIASITTQDCARLVERVVDRPARSHAGKVLSLLKQFFKFAEGRDLIQRNPASRLDPDDLGIVHGRRKRWLAEEELPMFWKALDELQPTATIERHDPRTGKTQTYVQHIPALAAATRAGLRLLLLTGVRTGELLLAKWADVNLDKDEEEWEDGQKAPRPTWTIPVANQKLSPKQARDAHPFALPLVPEAVALLDTLRAEAKGSPWVMASSDPKSKLGRYEDHSLNHAMRRMFGTKEKPGAVALPGGPVSPHDLRRTLRTQLAKLRIAPHITERCLNHSLGRIVQTYDLHDYLPERREALERWTGYLLALVTGVGAEVVPFAPRAKRAGGRA